MGFFRVITHYFMGKCDSIETDHRVKDGKIISNDDAKEESAKENEAVSAMDIDWEVPVDYIEALVRRGVKEKTAKEYAIDVRSFGINPEDLTVDQIKNRISPLKEATKRRKLTALKSYARWLLSVDKTALWIEISRVKTGELLS